MYFSHFSVKTVSKLAHLWPNSVKPVKTGTFDGLKGARWGIGCHFDVQEGDTGAKIRILRPEMIDQATNFWVIRPGVSI